MVCCDVPVLDIGVGAGGGVVVTVVLSGCVVFVEVGVVGVSFGEVVSVGEPVGLSVVVVAVDEEFSVVWSVLCTEKAARRTQGIVPGRVGKFPKVGSGTTSGIGVPNSE